MTPGIGIPISPRVLVLNGPFHHLVGSSIRHSEDATDGGLPGPHRVSCEPSVSLKELSFLTCWGHSKKHFGYHGDIRGPFETFVDWRQCAAVMQREAVTIMPSCSCGGNVVVE
jgi:hypothetical protein